MKTHQFSRQLKNLCLNALRENEMAPEEIIGNLEIAKLNVDRYFTGGPAKPPEGVVDEVADLVFGERETAVQAREQQIVDFKAGGKK